MMMSYGLFVFALGTVPYQDFQRQLAWRHPSVTRIGASPVTQFLGRDDETATLSGVLLPEITGGRLSLAEIEEMAEGGRAWPLIEGTGYYYGLFVVTGL
jgi:phage protein U